LAHIPQIPRKAARRDEPNDSIGIEPDGPVMLEPERAQALKDGRTQNPSPDIASGWQEAS
jgi:hypothetical protein